MHWVQILDRVYAECRLPPGTLYTRPLQHTDKRTSMRRHCLSRSTWRPLCGGNNYSLCPSRYASIRTLGELPW